MAEQHEQKPVLDYSPPVGPTVPLYRKVLSYGLLLAGVVVAVVGLFVADESARVNMWTVGGGLIVLGLVIRFQHVRL